MILYDRRASGHCWKVRLLLSFLGLSVDRREVDILKGEARTPAFLAINPRGEIPVLVDGDVVIADSQAILAYLARRHGSDWLPLEPVVLAGIMRWLAVAGQEMQRGTRAARGILRFGMPGDLAAAQAVTRSTLMMLDTHLAGRDWLVGDRPTIADVAIYPYAVLADEAGVPVADYPALAAWAERFRQLPGYVDLAA